jgi:precorrin-3B C17-methyltransferase
MLKHRSPGTPVGIVTAASRDQQSKVISTLQDFTKEEINMFSLVIIGNSQTYVQEGWMVTPRGYEKKEQL